VLVADNPTFSWSSEALENVLYTPKLYNDQTCQESMNLATNKVCLVRPPHFDGLPFVCHAAILSKEPSKQVSDHKCLNKPL